MTGFIRQSFTTTVRGENAAEVETAARAACDAWFGDKPYRAFLRTEPTWLANGKMYGHECEVRAEEVGDPDA